MTRSAELTQFAIEHWREAGREAALLAQTVDISGWHSDAKLALMTLANLFAEAADKMAEGATTQAEQTATPGMNTGLGIVLLDEPESCGVTTFADRGEVVLSFDARPGADFSQVIIGLTPRQAQQLLMRLSLN